MGWFDESDDEEDGPKLQKTVIHAVAEEEDPLDAYMRSLESTAQNTTSRAPRAARLDVDNEDEATSHWINNKKNEASQSEEIDPFSKKAAAKQALEETFQSAGGNNNNNNKQTARMKLDKVNHGEMGYEDVVREFKKPLDTPAGHKWRSNNGVTCAPGTFDPIVNFQEIADILGNDLLGAIHKKGYINPTPVQAQTLAVAMAGRDALVTAETGSGKTLAYAWPMVVHVCDQRELEEGEGPIGLVLVPTRELAVQVQKHVRLMLQPLKGKSIAITGGVGSYQIVQDFRKSGCEVVVATPGRFLDVLSIKKNGISLKRVTFLVLDECDKMLEMGFENQVSDILNNIRPDRQSLMLSATLSRKIERVTQKWLTNPVRISVGTTGRSSEHVQQHVMVLPSFDAKKAWLLEMIPVLSHVGRTLVFVATKTDCEVLASAIREADASLVIETLHGDKHPTDRQAALKAFERGQLAALVATDVASRGLDVANVSTVINFDPAKNLDIHVHRIGRAGRLEKANQKHSEGVAYILLTHKNADFANTLMNAFEREGKEVTADLRNLAQKSRRFGNVVSRTRWNKSGLGFGGEDPANNKADSIQPPTAKRSRWS